MDIRKESLKLHGEWQGKIEVNSRVAVTSRKDLSLAYTPGVAEACLEIQKDVTGISGAVADAARRTKVARI